ncbi:ribonuclease H-like domain-containing protein [Tanacetum coccineum]
MTEDEQVLHDDLEKMIAQEVIAKALDDATRQAFEEEKRNIASQKRAAQATSTNKLSTVRSSVSTATTPYVCTASTPSGANAGESSFVYLGGKIPIDASTLPNANIPIDPNMSDLEDASDAFSNNGIFNGAYDDENVGAVADFNNMDDTINVSPIPTLRIHKNHPKDQILGDPKSAVQTRGKIQKASSAQQALLRELVAALNGLYSVEALVNHLGYLQVPFEQIAYHISSSNHKPVNYALMAISSSSSSSSSDNEVQKCSKQCLDSFKNLQKNYDSEREKDSRARLEIQGYELALDSLESMILVHEKNELAWGEKYEFQNYELKCREIKINNLNLELEKVVKERDELKLKIEKWEESSKNLDELLNSQMSARDKTGLGYGTQLNEMSNNSETDSEISLSVFDVRSSDEESTPANDMLSKADGYHVVPPPITGNFLTPRADISFAGLDEYAIRKKIIESKTTDLNTKTSETVGKTNEVNTQKPKTVYESVNRDKVIIEDWNSDDEDDVSEVQTVSPVKTNESQTVKPRVDKIGQTFQKQGIGFKKIKACFVYKSTDHLSKDCNFYDKKSQEPKLKNVVNNGPRMKKPVWDNAKRVNHQKISNKLKYPHLRKTFVPSGVLTKKGLTIRVKQNEKRAVHTVSTARPVCTARPVSTVRPFTPKIAQSSGAIRPIYTRMDNVRPRGSYSPIMRSYYTKLAFRPKDLKQDVKTFGVQNITTAGTRAVVNTSKVITCLYANAKTDMSSKLWHRRLGHVNFKNINKLVKGHLVRGLPSKVFVNDHTCVPLLKDSLGKFDGKSDEGYLLGYSTSSKAFRVYNKRTKRVEDNLHIDFFDSKPSVAGNGTQDSYVAGSSGKDKGPTQEYILLLLHPYRTRILVEDVAPAAHEKPSESSPKDNDVQDSEDVADKE